MADRNESSGPVMAPLVHPVFGGSLKAQPRPGKKPVYGTVHRTACKPREMKFNDALRIDPFVS